MDIIEAIVHAVVEALGGILSPDAVRVVVSFLVVVLVTIVGWFINPISLRVPLVRRVLRHEEKYCGNYVQIIQSEEERRYSLIRVFYSNLLGKYVLSGRQYDSSGRPAIEFKSNRVSFVEDIYTSIEFAWIGGALNLAKYEGFTKMIMTDSQDFDMLEGQGFFITFDEVPRRVDMKFLRMTKTRLREFGLVWPRRLSEVAAFIAKFHAKLQDHPEHLPVEDSKMPLVI
jgi:hypothetical protein